MKKLVLVVLMLMVLSTSLVSAQGYSSQVQDHVSGGKISESEFVPLDERMLSKNAIIYATPDNQDKLIKQFNLKKPSDTAQLLSIRFVEIPNDTLSESNKNSELNTPNSLFGYRFVQKSVSNVTGWEEIARGEYHCATWRTAPCTGVEVEVTANTEVSVNISTSFGVGYNDIISAEFGYSEGATVGVSTTVIAPAPPIPVGRTFVAVGYPIYRAHFFELYKKGIFSDTLLGTGTFMEPRTSTIAVTDWLK